MTPVPETVGNSACPDKCHSSPEEQLLLQECPPRSSFLPSPVFSARGGREAHPGFCPSSSCHTLGSICQHPCWGPRAPPLALWHPLAWALPGIRNPRGWSLWPGLILLQLGQRGAGRLCRPGAGASWGDSACAEPVGGLPQPRS